MGTVVCPGQKRNTYLDPGGPVQCSEESSRPSRDKQDGGVGTGICCYILRPAHSLLFVFNFSASFPATASVVLGILTGIIDDFIANLLKKTALPRGSLSPASAPKCQ